MAHRARLKPAGATCKYLRYEYYSNGKKNKLILPLVQIRIKTEADTVSTTALVDSGANVTLIPQELAEILEVKYEMEKGKPVVIQTTGAGGEFASFETRLKSLSLLKGGKAFWSTFGVPVLVPDKPNSIPYAILGRDLVFGKFDITFFERSQKFTFSP